MVAAPTAGQLRLRRRGDDSSHSSARPQSAPRAANRPKAKLEAVVFQPQTAVADPAAQRSNMQAAVARTALELDDMTARLQASETSRHRLADKYSALQSEVKRLRKDAHTTERELVWYRNAVEEGETQRAALGEKVRELEQQLFRANASNRTMATRPGAETAARHERKALHAKEQLSVATEHAERLEAALAAKQQLVERLQREAALLKREGSLLAEALDSRCASTPVRTGHADSCSHAECWRRAGRRWARVRRTARQSSSSLRSSRSR